MIAFWISAAVLSALAAALVVQRSAAAAAFQATAEDPAVAVFRRQLMEIDNLAERGLLPETERRSARAEAARRLLSAADSAAAPAASSASGRLPVAVAAALIPLAAIGLYLLVGSPGAADQPFASRLAAWRAADPASLSPPQMAAVLSRAAAEHPADPTPLYYLARLEVSLGQTEAAAHEARRAVALAPGRADLWGLLGAILAAQPGGDASAEAKAAFQQSLALDPANADARYFLSRARIAGGDVEGGLAGWRALVADLKPDDPRRAGLSQEIAQVERTRALPEAGEPSASGAGQAAQETALIHAMVARLAARLQANPDDPAGWARLIHADGVLGDGAAQAAARNRALAQFKAEPAARAMIEAAR
ncbi:MAG: c-type cytochrome biogenesis protein CcmI [Caulobacteraceae bacterium]|nr:c-type cytochrome biogenesis protein CcmI [Caulobacteraceae bacterium]